MNPTTEFQDAFTDHLWSNEAERHRLFALLREHPGGIMVCVKHRRFPVDVWYDCDECASEAHEWAGAHGFRQCVSPHIRRDGSDNGAWVTENAERWLLFVAERSVCHMAE